MSDEIYRYVLGHLMILTDEQLEKMNFNAGIRFINRCPDRKESNEIIELLSSIQQQFSLSHHGILGQKWGVRRYRNKDGILTSEGKKRYADGSNDSLIFQKKL